MNCARGPEVENAALYRALTEGRLAGAALDMLEEEPADPHNPLLTLLNVAVCPHIASMSEFTVQEIWRLSAETIVDLRRGRRPRSVVNPSVTPRRSLVPRAGANQETAGLTE